MSVNSWSLSGFIKDKYGKDTPLFEEVGAMSLPELNKKDGNARVGVTMGFAFEYGAGKCTATVSLQCDQDEDVLDQAADIAMLKAEEIALSGMQRVQNVLEDSNK